MLLFSQGNPGLAKAPAENHSPHRALGPCHVSLLPSPPVSHTDPMELEHITKLSGVFSVNILQRGAEPLYYFKSHYGTRHVCLCRIFFLAPQPFPHITRSMSYSYLVTAPTESPLLLAKQCVCQNTLH